MAQLETTFNEISQLLEATEGDAVRVLSVGLESLESFDSVVLRIWRFLCRTELTNTRF